MSTETVSDEHEPIEQPIEQEVQETAQESQEVEEQQTQVPLSALQKERRKRQEAEEKARLWEEHQARASQQESEEDQYEPITKAQAKEDKREILRSVREETWKEKFPDRAAEVDAKLDEFLKTKPHLALAIKAAPNRYEEAWELMDKLTPKQKAALKETAAPKREAPGSPSGIPKAAGINQAVDVMNMTDAEFSKWRASKRRVR